LRPLARVLRPLVKLMIRSGVTFPVLAEMLRTLYVDVASRDVVPGEKARTDSRISLLTGIHRKELRRQRTLPADEPEPSVVTLNSQLMARWLGDSAYVEAGRPAALPRTGPAPSFEALVAGVTRDLRPRAVLDEWLAQGIAALDADGRVVLAAAGFLPSGDRDARLFYFGRNLHDHIAAAAANVTALGAVPFIDRSLHYDGLGLEAAGALEAHAREAAARLLVDVNRTALAIADNDDVVARQHAAGTGPRPTRRVNLGVFVYVEDESSEGMVRAD
jgi:hypothetical protein